MAKHVVEVEDVKDFIDTVDIASSFGKGEDKCLRAYIRFYTNEIVYRVFNHGEVVSEGKDVVSAIVSYNSL